MRTWVKSIGVAALLATVAAWADPTQYVLQQADGKTFVVKDHLGRPRTHRSTRLLDLTRPRETAPDAGTLLPPSLTP